MIMSPPRGTLLSGKGCPVPDPLGAGRTPPPPVPTGAGSVTTSWHVRATGPADGRTHPLQY